MKSNNMTFYTLLNVIGTICLWMMTTATAQAAIRLGGHRLSVKDGLSCNTVNDITQDSEGFIWLATANGISRYDGYQFVNFSNLSENSPNNISIAQLVNDKSHSLVWGYNSSSILCCYDLKKGQFSEYNAPKAASLLRNRFKGSQGIWLFSADFGVRHINYSQGQFHYTDYTVKNGKIAGDRQLQLAEDAKHNVWIASDKGLNLVAPDGKSRTLISRKHVVTMTCEGNTIAILTKDGDAYLFDATGKITRKSHLPSTMGHVEKSRASFFWQGDWYIFTRQETYAMNLKTVTFRKPEMQIPNAMDKTPLKSYHFLFDKQGNAYLIGKKTKLYRKFHLLDDKAYINARDKNFTAAEDIHGKVWITSYGNGLFVYNPKDDTLQHFSAHDERPLFHSNFLLNLYIDRSGCIWCCTGDGIYCFRETKELESEHIQIVPGGQREWSNFVRHISLVGNSHLMVSTRANNTFDYDLKTRKATLALQTNACVYCYAVDPKGRKWIGTKGQGIYIDGIQYSKYDKDHAAPSASFYDVVFDSRGRAWLATWGNGVLLTPQEGGKKGRKFETFLAGNGKEAQIHDLVMDTKGRLWFCTNNGLAMVDTNSPRITEKSFVRFNEENGLLPIGEIDCGLMAHDGTLWLATTNGIIRCTYDEKGRKLVYKLYNTASGLAVNTTRSLAEDRYGNIWIGTEEGLAWLDTKTSVFRSFQPGSSIRGNNFTENCAVSLPDGRIMMGVANGLLAITPMRNGKDPRREMRVAVTDLTINGLSVLNEETALPLKQALSYTREISLPADKNSITVYFSNFDYPHIKNAMYQYRMEGIDKDWRPTTSINHAEFSELSPGHYTLYVRTRTGDNTWSHPTTLSITIRQPWYNTWWAWCIYLAVAGTLGTFFYRSWRRNFELHQQVEIEKQMAEFRIDFFTHISHEFRTPLAIIQGAVEKMVDKGEGYASKNTINTLVRGTKRLQRLINQLMEFRKITSGNMKLRVERGDIVGFIRTIYNDIYTIGRQKDISMSLTPWTASHEMLFDPEKVETIVYNLLSNAVKYTPDKGTISVRLGLEDGVFTLCVEDSGPGIKADRETDLFKPFMHGYASKGGMGIGLYTARQMAEIHKGTVTYERSAHLGGSLFRLSLPGDNSVYQPEDIAEQKALQTASDSREEIDLLVKEMTPQAINDITIMVIEDDPDMMEQIKQELSVYFKVEAFMDGKAGYENIRRIKPALLICDIMLPGMSGYEIVTSMKADPDTQDIPVIMLTAFDDAKHILKAYKSFVDDYMVKPCNFKLLIARALQFVASDAKARDRKKAAADQPQQAATPQESSAPAEPTILMSTLDKKFKDKLEAIVAQHISDSTFNVDRLAELLNLGRTTVYNRTKAIMGISPNMYIQNERLRIAANLLLEGEYTVGEISDKVGFSDSTYFYKCFKSKYGVAPSRYGK